MRHIYCDARKSPWLIGIVIHLTARKANCARTVSLRLYSGQPEQKTLAGLATFITCRHCLFD
jgi:hypothetical protein